MSRGLCVCLSLLHTNDFDPFYTLRIFHLENTDIIGLASARASYCKDFLQTEVS